MFSYGFHAPVEQMPPQPDPALAGYRVLLVEDDPEYGRMVERVLRRARPPLWVHREERLAAGLHRLERDHYDALVMDLKLPDTEGRATLENACAQAKELPVVVLTSTDDEGLALDAIRGGAEDYLVKQRTHALSLPGAVLHAIARHRRNDGRLPAHSAPRVSDEIELERQIARAIARAHRRQTPVAVMMAAYADLDWLREAFVPAAIERLGARAVERLALRMHRGDVLAYLDATRFAVVVERDADRTHLEGLRRACAS